MNEQVKIVVTVNINYNNKTDRAEAIKLAKECVLSTRILGSTGCYAKSARLMTKNSKK